MARTHARAPCGQRAIGAVPHGHWQTSTFLAALRCDRLTAPCVIDGPINGLTFQAYVEQILLPTLQPGDIVIIDNLGSHKGNAVRHAIEQAGAFLLYLPPYSPDLNPSSRSSPSSRRCCAKPPPALSKLCGPPSAHSLTASHSKNAPDTSETLDTDHLNGICSSRLLK